MAPLAKGSETLPGVGRSSTGASSIGRSLVKEKKEFQVPRRDVYTYNPPIPLFSEYLLYRMFAVSV
jgi:hypothetical protein